MNPIGKAAMLLLLGGGTAMAQEAKGTGGEGGGQSLDQAASDPTASLLSVQAQNIYAGDYHLLDGETGNTVLLRAAVPFETGALNHIARITVPAVTDSPSRESGLGDIALFDLLAFDESWGRWGVGPVLLTPTASGDSLVTIACHKIGTIETISGLRLNKSGTLTTLKAQGYEHFS